MADSRTQSPDSGRDREESKARRLPRRRIALRLDPGRAAPRNKARGWAAAIAVHIVVGVVLFRALTFGHGIDGFFNFGERESATERVTYVAAPAEQHTAVPKVAEVPQEATVPVEPKPPVVPPTMPPVEPPVAPPVTPPAGAAASPPATGAAGATGGAAADTGSGYAATRPAVGDVPVELRGVRPSFTDARLWGMAGPGAPQYRTGAERLDSIISYAIVAAADSLDAIARARGEGGRRPGDWTTTDKNGDKWGWDEGGIRLGKVTIPNALLGLLPMNAQMAMSGNPTAVDRERRLSLARRDIMANSQRSVGEVEFKKLVKELSERKEREYQERQKAKKEVGRIITNNQDAR